MSAFDAKNLQPGDTFTVSEHLEDPTGNTLNPGDVLTVVENEGPVGEMKDAPSALLLSIFGIAPDVTSYKVRTASGGVGSMFSDTMVELQSVNA